MWNWNDITISVNGLLIGDLESSAINFYFSNVEHLPKNAVTELSPANVWMKFLCVAVTPSAFLLSELINKFLSIAHDKHV